ncbi:sensor domain-containing diguanylate cyclase [Shewanella colwelliana]|uniref:sensor domain-containing diguanylate cyclase n=1 Tax=Shewanella colwelliana TaxID=23 RepID=UPI0022AEDC0A|nr:sensor domain-containing diguanylate cyclase [Shewanella colwelliana]MCZ4335855.1 sensor domain-containing diguanylate cyclase [Shewanella colwelliana]
MRRFNDKLYLKITLAIVTGTALVALLSSLFFYFMERDRQHEFSLQDIKQLSATIESTATVAVYVQDAQLALEIIEGVVKNGVVAQAQLNSEPGFSVFTGSEAIDVKEQVFRLALNHPFNKQELIGELLILPDIGFINQHAERVAYRQAKIMLFLTITIALLVSLIVHKGLTSPLKILTQRFEEIKLGQDSKLAMLANHETDEIGSLVKGINSLISSLHSSIEAERSMRKKTERLEKRFRMIFEKASAGICLINEKNELLTANPACQRMLSQVMEADACIGKALTLWFQDDQGLASFLEDMRADTALTTIALDLKLSREVKPVDVWLHCLFSKVIENDDNKSLIIEVLMYDVTERTQRERDTRFEADHDVLTHLKNRRAGQRLLNQQLDKARVWRKIVVVMVIDLDDFKPVNDQFGHDAGDLVLVEVGRRIIATFRHGDICVRWGGDEFVVGCYFDNDYYDEKVFMAIEKLATQLVEALHRPIELLDGNIACIGASVGVGVFPHHGQELMEVINEADKAMYQAKKQGKNGFAVQPIKLL